MPDKARYAREQARALARGSTPYRERIAAAAQRRPGATRAELAGHGGAAGRLRTTGGPVDIGQARQQISRLGSKTDATLILHFADGSKRTLYGYGRHAQGMRMTSENKKRLRDDLGAIGKAGARYERQGLRGRSTLVGVEVAWQREA